MKIIDFDRIMNLNLPPRLMYLWMEQAWKMQDECILPPKVRMWQGTDGRYIAMPCVIPGHDLAGLKFVSRNVDRHDGYPARNSHIILQSCSTHGLLAVMDGIFITNMRTGANAAMGAIRFAKSDPESIAVYGLGIAARSFMVFFAALWKKKIKVKLLPYKSQADDFIERFRGHEQLEFVKCDSLEELFDSDIIVSCVSFARNDFCHESLYRPGCTIIPVQTRGFRNCDLVFDRIIVDDIGHVEGYRYYEQFKNRITRITDVVNGRTPGRLNDRERILFYSGGIAVHDIYFAVKILELVDKDAPQVTMSRPNQRFWI